MNGTRSLKYNISSLYILKVSKWFMLVMPIIVVFYQENGLSMKDVFILQAIYSIAIFALEIPSGYFADVLGRKNTLVAGSIFGFIGYGIYTVSHSFTGFLFAELAMGIGQSLISGADSATLYDTLVEKKKEKQYLKMEGRMVSTGNFAEALAGILGGFLAEITIRTPFYYQAGVALMAIPAALMITEPYRHKTAGGMSMKNILQAVRYSLQENTRLRNAILFSSVIGTSTLTMAWFVQPYFKQVGIPLAMFGVLWTLLNFSVGLTALFSYKIERLFGSGRFVLFITISLPAGYLLLSQFSSIWAIGFLFVFYLIRGVATPVLKNYIHEIATSDIRATVLSVRNFIIRLNFSLIGPFLGWYTDTFSLSEALLLASIIFFVCSLLTAIIFIKKT